MPLRIGRAQPRKRNYSRIALAALSVAIITAVVPVMRAFGDPSIAGVNDEKATVTSPTGRYANGALLPNGRLVRPIGDVIPVGDFPVAMTISPDRSIAVVANSGQGEGDGERQGNESLQVVDLDTNRVIQTITDHEEDAPTFYNAGLAFSSDGKHLYATGGGNDQVYDYTVTDGQLRLANRWVSTEKEGAPASGDAGDVAGFSRGLAISPDDTRLFVTNEQGGSVAALDTSDGHIAWETQLGGSTISGPYPGSVAVSHDGGRAYVTAQGTNVVATLDTTSGAVIGTTPVGDHPVAIAITADDTLGFVANANDDSVSILDVSGSLPQAANQLSVHLFKGEAAGSSPNGIAIDEERKILYVANAGDDAVAALGQDVTTAPKDWSAADIKLQGFLPTGWYPTAVGIDADDGSLLAASAKGYGGVPLTSEDQYDGNDMVGLVTRIGAPSYATRRSGQRHAVKYLRWAQSRIKRPHDSPIPNEAHAGESPIKHVVMVVRENRTFDQVFGDIKHGADVKPAYLEFPETDANGKTITPNAHSIAQQFGLSDNFYSDGEASIQGHHWTAEGTSTDYTEKSWLHYYSARNHPYDPVFPVVYPRCGAIFQQLAQAGIPFKNFGELVGLATSQAPAGPAPDQRCTTPGGAFDETSIANHDFAYPDNLTLTSIPDTDRLEEFKRVYGPLVQADQVPGFSYVLMGNDHTEGESPGSLTPQAFVAINDLAVGGLVDYLSQTPQWKSTLVVIVEDDSQDGLDHRDGHRNIMIAAGPYVKPGVISHLHISQASVLHTIELILGIEPLSNYTQTAPVPYDMFTSKPNDKPYKAITPTYDMTSTNPEAALPGTPGAVPINLSGVDVAGPVLEAQIWWAVHPGEGMPRLLIDELRERGGIRAKALRAWAKGRPCECRPLLPGLTVAPGEGDDLDG